MQYEGEANIKITDGGYVWIEIPNQCILGFPLGSHVTIKEPGTEEVNDDGDGNG